MCKYAHLVELGSGMAVLCEVRFCVDELGAPRIAHGVLAAGDEGLVAQLAELKVCRGLGSGFKKLEHGCRMKYKEPTKILILGSPAKDHIRNGDQWTPDSWSMEVRCLMLVFSFSFWFRLNLESRSCSNFLASTVVLWGLTSV